jgi:hypothetical protein
VVAKENALLIGGLTRFLSPDFTKFRIFHDILRVKIGTLIPVSAGSMNR